MCSTKTYKIVKFVIFVLLGLSILFLKETYIENLQYFIGALISIYAIDELCLFIFEKVKEKKSHHFFKSLVEIILGICTLIFFKELATICIIWAVWSILREADEIQECHELFKEKVPSLLNFVESIVAIVFSILLIIEPGEHHAMTHMYLLIVELLTAVIFPQLRWIYIKYIKKSDKEINE